jgi:flagellar L-ring protein precursor FlgH
MNTTTSRGSGGHLLLMVAAAAWLLLCLPPAVAQRNSLLGRRFVRQPEAAYPTTQPAGGMPAAALPGAGLGVRAAVEDTMREPKPNAVLLYNSPFAVRLPEPEVLRVHDQVTIIVRESKSAMTKAKLEQKKDWTHEWELSKWIRFSAEDGLVPNGFPQGNPAVAFDYKDDYGGDGKYDRRDELTTRIQATVIDVKPNGVLVLEAKKGITIDEEGYTITLTGSCRSVDVTPTNTVLSTQIANLDVQVHHTGAMRDAQRRGWLKRGLDLLRPF